MLMERSFICFCIKLDNLLDTTRIPYCIVERQDFPYKDLLIFIPREAKALLTSEELRAGLAQCTGTSTWFRFSIGPATLGLYTEGVQYLAKNAECYWLLMEIFTVQADERVQQEPFQVWDLGVDLEKQCAVLTCEDGNHGELYKKEIPYTDFPLEEISLWVEYEEGIPVLLLPLEH